MLIYLFKDKDNKIHVASEREAHSKIRNLSNWERQDLKYLGACQDTISTNKEERKAKAMEMVINENQEVKNLETQIKIARLEGKEKEVEILISKRELAASYVEISVNKLGTPTDMPDKKDDINRSKYMKYINQLEEEEINKLKPDIKLIPRDFNRIQHSFGGKEME